MRRADRLFRIVQFLRAGRLQTARSLAQKLQVSDRTIYRDVQDLQLSGVPILGEAGVGYTLRRDYDLPPLMFDQREITALVLGSRMVAAWGDAELAAAANDALRKIEAVLTPAMRDHIDAVPLHVPAYRLQNQGESRKVLEQLRGAIESLRIVRVVYGDEKERVTERTLRPMALLFWGNVWTLVAWCELRVDFRSFRIDRFKSIEVLDATFTPERGQRYEDFLAQVRQQLSSWEAERNGPGKDLRTGNEALCSPATLYRLEPHPKAPERGNVKAFLFEQDKEVAPIRRATACNPSFHKLPMRILLAALLIAAAGVAQADSGPALKTINNPSGGQVVYGVFDQESTIQGAMVSMLRKVHANFGERPQIGQFFQTRDHHTMGTFFTVTAKNQGGKPIAGMVMVTMPSGLKPAAAALFDDAARFRTTEPQLMKKLTEAFNNTPASNTAASPNPAASPEHHGTGGPVAALQQAAVADNSASIGLPAGWHITGGGGGSLHAEGPKGESIHMGVINQNIYDPNTQQGQNMISYMSKGRTPFSVCPFTNDLVAGYQCVARQNRQRNHLPQLSMKVNSVKNLGQGAVLVAAEIDFNDGKGPMTASIRLGTIRTGPAMWALTVNQANVPVALADQEWPTIGAMAASYRQNGQVIQAQTDQVIANIHAQGRANQARIDEHNREVDQNKTDFENHMDNIDRQSKAQQNYTLDQSVLQDNEIPARGTVTNPTADAYVRANPDRYQIVPQQDWIKGQDY